MSGVAYDARDFPWLGRVTTSATLFFTWHSSATKRFADARTRETTMGSSGSGDTTDPLRALNALAGAKFKLVLGYRGSNDVQLAIERGEIEGGYALWSDFKFRQADWLRDKQVNLLFFVGDKRDPNYPDVPLAEELVPSEEGKRIMALFAAPSVVGRSFFTAPGVPVARVELLRQAFAAMLADRDFLADAQRVGTRARPDERRRAAGECPRAPRHPRRPRRQGQQGPRTVISQTCRWRRGLTLVAPPFKSGETPWEVSMAEATRKLKMADIHAAAERLKNWGRFGAEDEIGTLNYTRPEDIVAAARLVQKGKVMSLALAFDHRGPQGAKSSYGSIGRFNPIHLMLRTGTDAYSGVLDHRKIRGADDIIIMPMQCGTQWDGLGHIFYGDHMWNGYDCRTVTSAGAQKCGIEQTRERMVGRGLLFDIPLLLGQKYLPDGFAVTCEHLDQAERRSGAVKRGDYLLVRTGQIEAKLAAKNWHGYPGGDAPGLAFETLDWLHKKEMAAIATDTWGVEVRPNETDEAAQPWHWISIPIMGLTVGEIFNMAELANDCAEDKRYEFMFVAPALPVTGAVGSPVNPLAIK